MIMTLDAGGWQLNGIMIFHSAKASVKRCENINVGGVSHYVIDRRD